jgi:hypothetical protein
MNASRTVQRHRDIGVLIAFAVKTRNPNNGAMGHSRLASILKSKERKAQRELAHAQVLSARPLPDLPVTVRITRVAPSSGLDPHDGLGAALKGIIDGTADALGLKNDRDARVTWLLDQTRGAPGYYGVEIRIAARDT